MWRGFRYLYQAARTHRRSVPNRTQSDLLCRSVMGSLCRGAEALTVAPKSSRLHTVGAIHTTREAWGAPKGWSASYPFEPVAPGSGPTITALVRGASITQVYQRGVRSILQQN